MPSIADRMAEQHEVIDARLVATAHHLDAGELASAEATLAELAAGLRQHIAVEEAHLFPAFEGLALADLEIAAAMRTQHRELEQLVAAMATALGRRERGPALHAKAALHAALGAHDDEEEAICAALDRGLDAGARAQLITQLGR